MAITLFTKRNDIKKWWISLLLGLLYIALGIWILATPLESYVSLSLLFSAFIVLSGIFWIAFSISVSFALKGWGWFLVGGILELVIGTLLMLYPSISLAILPFFIAFCLFLVGIMGIGSALQYKALGSKNWGWPLAFGLGAVIFAVLLLANPIFAGVGIVIMTGLALITLGIFRVIFAYYLRRLNNMDLEP